MNRIDSRRPSRRTAVVAVAALAVGLALWWFQPHQLVIDREVNEALPAPSEARREPGAAGEHEGARPALETLASGRFRPLAHDVSGSARLLRLANGDRYLRLEDFSVENGPDLRVLLSPASAHDGDEALRAGYIDLGALKGNLGNQNYRIPPAAELERFRSAVIWCRRFAVGFATAPLG
jgi:hypothetical protein